MPKSKMPNVTIREAVNEDAAAIRQLDDVSFPLTDPAAERAAPGELETGIEHHEILIAEMLAALGEERRIVGFVQYTTLRPGKKYYLAGMATDPEFRRHGIASKLVHRFIELVVRRATPEAPMVTCTTHPQNIASISVLLRAGFVVSRYIPQFFGEAKDRLFLEWAIDMKMTPSGHSVLVPVENIAYLQNVLDEVGYFITDVVQMPHGQYFQVDELREAKEEELNSNETSVSVSFTGILLSATAFLLGFISAAKSFPAPVLLYLLSAFVFLTVSLLAYTNATGEISRLKGSSFARFMIYGNIWSEFGGFYPLLHIVPVVVAVQFHSFVLGLSACVISAFALILYHVAGTSLVGRYIHNPLGRIVVFGYLSVSPIIGGIMYFNTGDIGRWSIANGVILIGLAGLCAFVLKEKAERSLKPEPVR